MNRRQFLKGIAGSAVAAPVVGLAYGRAEANWIDITRHTIRVPNLPPPFAGKTIALLTDPHHGPFNSLSFIQSIVEETNALKPDLIALSGDFIQGPRREYVAPGLQALGKLRASLGVYAVPGNHDHLRGNIDAVHRAINESGITNVTNAGRWIELDDHRLRIGGVDDLWHGEQDLDAALDDATDKDACLLLSHNPDYAETLRDPRVGLMLSGHMHGGQIVVPGLGYHCLPSRYGLKYLQGLIRAPRTQVFVSRGLGTVGLPLRIHCRPEINLLTLAAA
ncbi:MAG TPA: metallophosphoesterase [Gemmataceae bacterium]|nr:metallophosphoesterase [Gemmataceae bacterium]